MRNKLSELNGLIDDAITVSETKLDWKVKQGLVKSLSHSVFGLLRELRLPRDYCLSDDASCQDDVVAFIEFLRETQEIVTVVQCALRKKDDEAMVGHQGG